MENEKVCVFCGQKPGPFRSTYVHCSDTLQFACKSCEKELRELDEVEVCSRALRLRLAENPQRLEQRIALITQAEEHRPACLRCGTKLVFMEEQSLDNSPMGDGILSDTLDVIPAVCQNCGKMEFFEPSYLRRNKHIAYLIYKDTRP